MEKSTEFDEIEVNLSEEELSKAESDKNSHRRILGQIGAFLVIVGVLIMVFAYWTISYNEPETIPIIAQETIPVISPGITQIISPNTMAVIISNITVMPTPIETPVSIPENNSIIPTGKKIVLKVIANTFLQTNIEAKVGDEIIWNSFDGETVTIVELDKKTPNITLKGFGRANYLFTSPGNYIFNLFYQSTQISSSAQNINIVT